jgi:hypothetical protein
MQEMNVGALAYTGEHAPLTARRTCTLAIAVPGAMALLHSLRSLTKFPITERINDANYVSMA